MYVFKAVRVFFHLANPWIHRQARCFEHFLFLSFFWKLWNNCPKNRAKLRSPKNLEKWTRKPPQMDPKWLRICRKSPENLENGPQSCFFDGSFFWRFFGLLKKQVKRHFWSPRRGWGFPRVLQACEPGPRGRVGKGKSKYLRYLDSKRILSTRLEARGLGGFYNNSIMILS